MASLSDMLVERDRLNAAIAAEQERQRADWNDGLHQLEDALASSGMAVSWSTRKNERIAVLRGGGEARFGYLERDWGPWLTVTSADGFDLEWADHAKAPGAERFLAIVGALVDGDVKAERAMFPGRGH